MCLCAELSYNIRAFLFCKLFMTVLFVSLLFLLFWWFILFIFVIMMLFLLFTLCFFLFHLHDRFIYPCHHSLDVLFLIFLHLELVNVQSMCPLLTAGSLQIQLIVVSATSSPSSFHHGLICVRLVVSRYQSPRVWQSFFAIVTLWSLLFLIQLIDRLNLGFLFTFKF